MWLRAPNQRSRSKASSVPKHVVVDHQQHTNENSRNSTCSATSSIEDGGENNAVETVYCADEQNKRSSPTMMKEDETLATQSTGSSLVHSMLAALSFERYVPSSSSHTNETATAVASTRTAKTKKANKTKKRFLSRRFARGPPPTRVAVVDNNNAKDENSSSDVFFDAVEYGDDSNNRDSFRLRSDPRESVVLSGISIHQQSHSNIVETVLGSSSSSDSSGEEEEAIKQPRRLLLPPPPPAELPLRFLRAGKNDPVEGLRRYQATLQMRKDDRLDTILREPSPHFATIKQHYPHFCHLRGKQGEPCFYEQPPKTNLKALRQGGVNIEKLMRHYTMVTEYQWQYLERDDLAKSIYIIDLDGIRMTDFAGEAVEFLKRAAGFSAEHYPERAGYVFVINVPGWFKLIWTAVKPIVDEATLEKIYILRGQKEIRQQMQERIPLENIPPEYGGTSMPLGQSPEEKTMREWMEHNNRLADRKQTACSKCTDCKFCQWVPARSY